MAIRLSFQPSVWLLTNLPSGLFLPADHGTRMITDSGMVNAHSETIDSSKALRASKRILKEFQDRPLQFLPQRSVEAVNLFLSGYAIILPEIKELTSRLFDKWLAPRLFYPNDSGCVWWRRIQLNSRDACEGFDIYIEQFSAFLDQCHVESLPSYPRGSGHRFDFFSYLYAIGRRPGLYLGTANSPSLLAAHFDGGACTNEDFFSYCFAEMRM